jgi:predicted GH43/DUF377 family glycosyl hydrolase
MNIRLPKFNNLRGIGVSIYNDKPTLYFTKKKERKIFLAQSEDGIEFEKVEEPTLVLDKVITSEVDIENLIITRFSLLFKDFLMFYEMNSEGSHITHMALSQDLINFKTFDKLPTGIESGLMVENYVFQNSHVFYFGGRELGLGLTTNGIAWKFFDLKIDECKNSQVDYVLKTSQGIFVLYHKYSPINGGIHLEVNALCFDKDNPTKIIWKTKTSLWEEPAHWKGKRATCLGCLNFNGKILSYWNVEGLGIYLVSYPFYEEVPSHEHKHFRLTKHTENPILHPNPRHVWENEAVFNAAALFDGGKVFLLYRALGYNYTSVLGYAESTDGIHFQKRLEEPAYIGSNDFDTRKKGAKKKVVDKFISGGGFGGCEDPRVTKIGKRIYLVYVAFNGFEAPRLALTSILYDDFLNQRFLWEKPVLISPPGVVDKSGCILPEKINGKYVIFHRIFPNILIDFVDSLDEFDGSTWLKGEYKIEPRPTMWDSRKIGMGAPPLKTEDGWLAIYQGVTDKDDSKYKIGAMLLDLKDPTKVLYRSNHPIIEPTEYYENGLAKFGVVYPCGAVIKDGTLLVYYGGSDSVTCVASADLKEFLRELKDGSNPHLNPVKIND